MRLAPDARPTTPRTRTKRSHSGKFSETMLVTPNAPTDDTAAHLFRQVARIRAAMAKVSNLPHPSFDSLSLSLSLSLSPELVFYFEGNELSWCRIVFRNRIRARRSRIGDNTEETGLRDSLSLFTGPYNAAGNGCDGPRGTRRTLGRTKSVKASKEATTKAECANLDFMWFSSCISTIAALSPSLFRVRAASAFDHYPSIALARGRRSACRSFR
jgi:hypothetical protein